MKKLTDKEYIRNLHYHLTVDKTHYERLDDTDKEHLLFTMIEQWERLLMIHFNQDAGITSLEQLVDDLHPIKLPNKKHKYYKEIKKCITNLHQLNSWYEEIKTHDEFVLSGDDDE